MGTPNPEALRGAARRRRTPGDLSDGDRPLDAATAAPTDKDDA